MKNRAVCIGEVLWDALPDGMYLGGAPLNVAVTLRKLGITSSVISAVGDDVLGKWTLKKVASKGLDTTCIQENKFDTSLVEVEVDEKGVPFYTINENVAWDYIEENEDSKALIDQADYLIFGSLAFRNKTTADTFRS